MSATIGCSYNGAAAAARPDYILIDGAYSPEARCGAALLFFPRGTRGLTPCPLLHGPRHLVHHFGLGKAVPTMAAARAIGESRVRRWIGNLEKVVEQVN